MRIGKSEASIEAIDKILLGMFILLIMLGNFYFLETMFNIIEIYKSEGYTKNLMQVLENSLMIFFVMNVFASYSVVTLFQGIKKKQKTFNLLNFFK